MATISEAALFGSMGAFLLMSLGLGSISVGVNDPPAMMAALGVSRIAIGAVGAIALYTLVQADLLLGLFADSGRAGHHALSFLAGFSETLVPNALAKTQDAMEVELA